MIGGNENKGVLPRAIDQIFDTIVEREQEYEYKVCLSVLEIYNE